MEQFAMFKQKISVPIDGLNIPYICVPAHLASRKRQTQREGTIDITLRKHFNILSSSNLEITKENIKDTIKNYAKTELDIVLAAEEILQTFLLDTSNLASYMSILNYIRRCGVIIENGNDKSPSRSIGSVFVEKCGALILKYVGLDNVKTLGEKAFDLSDVDVLDEYNREREKIANLTETICVMYKNRSDPQSVSVKSNQIFSVLLIIINNYYHLTKSITETDPESENGEYNIELYEYMIKIVAEQLYEFMNIAGSVFVKDPYCDQKSKISFSDIVSRFKKHIVPSIKDEYLKYKCDNLTI